MSARRAAPAIARVAAALALGVPGALTACGEKDEPATGVSGADVRSLVTAAWAAAGADAPPGAVKFTADGAVLRVRIAAPPSGGALARALAAFRGVRAEVAPFCPKPALLRCRPALRAWASPRSPDAVETTVAALRRLAERTYDEPPLVRRRAGVTRVVTANGELLAAVRTGGAGVGLSFGGLAPPRRRADVAKGLEIEAGAEALAAMRRDLPPAARRALAGVRRLIVTAPLS